MVVVNIVSITESYAPDPTAASTTIRRPTWRWQALEVVRYRSAQARPKCASKSRVVFEIEAAAG
jgi:hypothetical protein